MSRPAMESVVNLPGSKSEANRLLTFAALVGNDFCIENIPNADDVQIFLTALRTAGVKWSPENEKIYVHGRIQDATPENVVLDMGMAGTAARFWMALACFRPGETTLTGDERLCQRPMAPLIDALNGAGADLACLQRPGKLPVRIKGRPDFCPDEFRLQAGVSSQFLSALLLCAPVLKTGARIIYDRERAVSRSYADLTIGLLKNVGAEWKITTFGYELVSCRPANGASVESDWSAASYPLAAALLQKTRLTLAGLKSGSLQADAAQLEKYRAWGLKTEFVPEGLRVANDAGLLAQPFDWDCSNTPDLAPTWAVLALFTGGKCTLSGLQTLKHKETDRIAALKNELQKFNAEVEADENKITLTPDVFPPSAPRVQTYNDHRMAMAFALTALSACGVCIENPGVVSKSFPGFWDQAKKWGICHVPF